MRNKLSVVVLTQNEEENIVDCLESIKFADEIIVVDDNSNDRTLDLVKQFTKKILHHPLNGSFSSQRNYALNYVHSDWVLFLDADERVSDKLKYEISKALEDTNFNGYYLRRIDRIWNTTINYGEGGRVELLRLARVKTGKWKGRVHEVWRISGNKRVLSNPLIHIPHKDMKNFIKEIDKYSTLRAQELLEEGKKSNFFSIIAYPLTKFILNYILRKGFKDGMAGLLYAIVMSLHSFLVRAKLYQLSNTK